MAESIVTIACLGVPADPHTAELARGRTDALGRAFHDLCTMLEQHAREHYDAFNHSQNRAIIEALLVKDMKTWEREVNKFAEDISRTTFYPPDTILPNPPLPAFPAFRAYVAVGGLINAMHTGAANAANTTRGAGGGGGSSSRKICRTFARTGACKWGAKCAFQHLKKTDGGHGAAGGGTSGGGGNGGHSGGGGGSSARSGGGATDGGAAGAAVSGAPAAAKKARTTRASASSNGDKGKAKGDAGAAGTDE